MPELPEVETIRRALGANLPGRKIVSLQVREARLRWPVDETRLRQLLVSQTVARIDRRSKYLLIYLRQESVMLIHLGMSGSLLLLSQPTPLDRHDHVIFNFEDGSELRYRDPRRFGMVEAVPPGGLPKHPRLIHLGPEPLAKTTRADKLFARASTLQRPIKNLLMDAGFLVGVGNIYASEALFHARVHPQTAAYELGLAEWRRLLRSVRRVLRRAIAAGGTTLNDFINSNGESGYFQLSLAVYGREGEPCDSCGTEIKRIVQVGRSSFFCENCQTKTFSS